MTKRPIHHSCPQKVHWQAQLELLEALVLSDVPYPWNPATGNTEDLLATVEQNFLGNEDLATDIAQRSPVLYRQLDQLWAVVDAKQTTVLEALQAALPERLVHWVPQTLLQAIAQTCDQLVTSPLSFADQLVSCVRELLPNWSEADLQVLARPLAYSMRSTVGDVTESVLASVRAVEWSELSDIEQARLSLAIARQALLEQQKRQSQMNAQGTDVGDEISLN